MKNPVPVCIFSVVPVSEIGASQLSHALLHDRGHSHIIIRHRCPYSIRYVFDLFGNCVVLPHPLSKLEKGWKGNLPEIYTIRNLCEIGSLAGRTAQMMLKCFFHANNLRFSVGCFIIKPIYMIYNSVVH